MKQKSMADTESPARRRICVIGAGAAGLCAVRHLASDPRSFEPVVFEQSNVVGGTWVYVDKTGLDDNGYPIHSSMYENLRTNLALKIMNFPDFQRLGHSDVACGTHQEVLNYLRDYADHFQLRQFIQFNTRVECVWPVENPSDWKLTTWKVRTKNLSTEVTEEREFDAVMVCNGHYFVPRVPTIPGIESFPGSVIHSHDYRKPEKYSGKRVIVLGAASSGFDIGLELTGHASHVYLSHNKDRLIGPLPSNMTQIAGVERVSGNEFSLRDGTKVTDADSFIYCTGYKYSFPFLDDRCEISVDDNYVSPLYKHLINVEHPSMCIVGIPMTVVPFALFHMQVQYHLAILKGRVNLPTKPEMLEDSRLKSSAKRHAHVLGDKQFDYDDDLAVSGGFERLPAFYKNGYIAWNASRVGNLLHFKDSKFIVHSDNATAEVVPWSEKN